VHTRRQRSKDLRAAETVAGSAQPLEHPPAVPVLDTLRAALKRPLTSVMPIGEGGMGTLDMVMDHALERHTVIKRIHDDLLDDPATLAMFVREAQITGQLEHPNIVPVHELGLEGDSVPFFTMKLVEGSTLDAMVKAMPPGPFAHGRLLDLVEAVIKVSDALSFAHSRGVIHCDLKPSNVMVGEFGQVYLMDWGIARRLGDPATVGARGSERSLDGANTGVEDRGGRNEKRDGNANAISAGALVGTPTHMAPEQALGALDRLDERTDVFALGGLLYSMLARTAPYVADNVWASIAKAQAAAHTPLGTLAPHTPRGLVRIVDKAMMLAPEDRYPSVAAMREELVAFVRGDGVFPLRAVAAGEVIVREGDEADAAYIIETGKLEAYRGEGDSRRTLREMGPGEVFGEMAILSPGPRTASVVALEDSQVRVVMAEALSSELDSLKPWMGAFVRTLATRFREREQNT
jgi:serine/threonine-protein kinase